MCKKKTGKECRSVNMLSRYGVTRNTMESTRYEIKERYAYVSYFLFIRVMAEVNDSLRGRIFFPFWCNAMAKREVNQLRSSFNIQFLLYLSLNVGGRLVSDV